MRIRAKIIVYLVVTLCYIALSNRMAHYYTNSEGREVVSTADKILLKPLNIFTSILKEPTTTEQTNSENRSQGFLYRSIFYINFFLWPFLVLVAIIFWVSIVVIFIILLIAAMVSIILTSILWALTYLILGFKLF